MATTADVKLAAQVRDEAANLAYAIRDIDSTIKSVEDNGWKGDDAKDFVAKRRAELDQLRKIQRYLLAWADGLH